MKQLSKSVQSNWNYSSCAGPHLYFLSVVEQTSDEEDLGQGHGQHDEHLHARQEVHPLEVVLLRVPIPCLKVPEHLLIRASLVQIIVHIIQQFLKEK